MFICMFFCVIFFSCSYHMTLKEVRGKTLQLCDAAALLSLGVAKDHCAHLETLIYLLRLQEQNQIITTQLSQPPMA
eukprot:m.59826 g.59826  ORF g.59826 m.59826 type:complete len:76 (+) comp11783_c0_seq4:854-1081(+)